MEFFPSLIAPNTGATDAPASKVRWLASLSRNGGYRPCQRWAHRLVLSWIMQSRLRNQEPTRHRIRTNMPLLRFRLCAVALTLALTACDSEPVHYHTLLAPSSNNSTVAQPADFLIEVLPVGIPSNLDQAELMVRQGASGLTALNGERWASSLSEEVRNAISSELTERLGTQDIAGLSPPSGTPLIRIKLQIRRLDAWAGQRIQLDADWAISTADDTGNERLLCHGRFEQPATGGIPALVAAEQSAIVALAARLDIDVRRWARSRTGACVQGSSTRGS